jgi:hypothetical protein
MPLSADEVGRRKMDMDEGFGVLKHNHKDRLNTEPKGGRARRQFHWFTFSSVSSASRLS